MDTGGEEHAVPIGEAVVRLPLAGGWAATAWGSARHRVTGAPAAPIACDGDPA